MPVRKRHTIKDAKTIMDWLIMVITRDDVERESGCLELEAYQYVKEILKNNYKKVPRKLLPLLNNTSCSSKMCEDCWLDLKYKKPALNVFLRTLNVKIILWKVRSGL